MSVELRQSVEPGVNWLGQVIDRQAQRSSDRWVASNRGRRRYLDLRGLLAARGRGEQHRTVAALPELGRLPMKPHA